MTLYFIPGATPRLKKLYIYSIYKNANTCQCIQQQSNNAKTGGNDPTQVENKRISQILSNNLGGKITWGNYGIPIALNYLGGIEGQPGGTLKPLRNKF